MPVRAPFTPALRRCVIAVGALATLATTASSLRAICPASYDYVVIADSADQFASFDRAPAIGGNGEVAFLADLDSGGQGIWAGDGGDPLLHALDQEADPASEIYAFFLPPSLGPSRHTAFVAFLDWSGGRAIFRGSASFPPSIVARNRNADPESPYQEFDSFEGPDLTVLDAVLFTASIAGTSGESAVVAGVTPAGLSTRIASLGIPERGFGAVGAHWESNDLALTAAADDNSVHGVYRHRVSLAEIAVASTGATGASAPAIGRGGISSTLAYRWTYLQEGAQTVDHRIERYTELAAEVLVDTADGVFERVGLGSAGDASVANVAVGGGCVGFRAEEVAGSDGVYGADENGVVPILRTGDVVANGWVWDVALGRRAMDRYGRVALWVEVQDLSTFEFRQLLVRADPVGASLPLFANGFQNGSTGAWSAAVP